MESWLFCYIWYLLISLCISSQEKELVNIILDYWSISLGLILQRLFLLCRLLIVLMLPSLNSILALLFLLLYWISLFFLVLLLEDLLFLKLPFSLYWCLLLLLVMLILFIRLLINLLVFWVFMYLRLVKLREILKIDLWVKILLMMICEWEWKKKKHLHLKVDILNKYEKNLILIFLHIKIKK